MNDRKWTGPLVAAILILAVTSTAVAHDEDDPQVNRVLGDKFSVRLIGGLVDLNSDVAAGSSLGALIDLEDILGFDEQIAICVSVAITPGLS